MGLAPSDKKLVLEKFTKAIGSHNGISRRGSIKLTEAMHGCDTLL